MAQTRLLIIDDDPDYVDGIKSILEKANYEVDAAYNPKDGFEALESKSYDLLLLDIMMGRGAEGVMVARKINKDPELREIPVLIITALIEDHEVKRAEELGCCGILYKPFKSDELVEKIASILNPS